MKNGLILAFVVLLVFGFMACDNGNGSSNNGTAPNLTEFITMDGNVTSGWTEKTTFSTTGKLGVGIKGTDPEQDMTKYFLTFKKNETQVLTAERNAPTGYNNGNFTHLLGSWSQTNAQQGQYSVEIYAIDSKGNKSNTLTANFSVE
jgi:hypothetical protein